ncbi:MAG: tetratricopeptide repeat protein [Chloroflexota bacterium]
MSDDRMLQEAIKAIELGQLSKARDLLTRLLRVDQSNVNYWLYLSAVVETHKERTFCLENVLKYDPGNKTAVQGLVMLGEMNPDDSASPVRPVNQRQWDLPKILGEKELEGYSGKKAKLSPVQIGSLAVFGLIAAVLLFLGIFGNPFFTGSGLMAFNNTPRPVFTLGPTPTYLPTSTPIGGVVSNVTGPTPLVFQLDETYTPTPRYVDTPHPVINAYASGMTSLDAENYEQAIVFLEQAADAAPNSLDILYYIGQAYLWSGDYGNARRYYDMIIQEDDAFAAAYVGRAEAILGMDPDRDMTVDLYKAVSLDPEYVEGHLAWIDFRLDNGYLDDAYEEIQIVFELDPDNARAYSYLAEYYIYENMAEEALEAAEEAFDRNMLDVDNYLVLSHALNMNHREEEAIALLETYLSHRPDDLFAWYLLGRGHLGTGNPLAAIEIFEDTYKERKNIYEMSYYWGLALIDIEEYEAAADRLLVPIQRIPRWFEPYAAQAEAYYLLEEYNFAKEALEAGSDRARSDEQLAALYYWRGLIYTKLIYFGIAEDNWESLLKLPQEVVPAEWWSAALLHTGATPEPQSDQAPTRVPTATPIP